MKDKIDKLLHSKLFWLCFLVIVLAFLVRGIAIEQIQISGISMSPTLENGDMVLVEKISYRQKQPERNDIVVFSVKNQEKKKQYVKRVIGLPGERVQIKDGLVYIDGEFLKEDTQCEAIMDAGMAQEEIVLGEDEYFVLGDNRNFSEDSRDVIIGIVNQKQIKGKVCFRILPFGRRGKVE